MPNLREEIETVINRCSAENVSNTPDWVLAEYLTDCLAAFDKATNARDRGKSNTEEHPEVNWNSPERLEKLNIGAPSDWDEYDNYLLDGGTSQYEEWKRPGDSPI